MIFKTYARCFTTDLEETLGLIQSLHEVEPHLRFTYGEWTLVGIGDVLMVGGTEERLLRSAGALALGSLRTPKASSST